MTETHDHPWLTLDLQARRRPDEEALVFPHQSARRTFAGWHGEARRLASSLLRLGLQRGDHIALLAENRMEWPIVQMACAAMGAMLVPLNTHYRKDDLAYALQQSRSKAILLSERFRSNPYLENVQALRGSLPLLEHVISLDQSPGALAYRDLAEAAPGPEPVPDLEPLSPAALLYTSGTTGFPKGALLTHPGMMMCGRQTAERLSLREGDRWTSMIPLFHCAGCIMNVLGSLQIGGAYVGIPAFDAEQLFRVIEAERATVMSGVPTAYLAMLQHPARAGYDLSSLRTGTCGGADANPDILQRCAAELPIPGLAQVYGLTETSTLVTCAAPDDPERFATAGPRLPGHEMRIVDPQTGAECAGGVIGEIQARGPMVMTGYYDNPEATAEALTPDGWLHTGDLGRLTPTGRLVIAGGRLKDMIIRGGENIYPAEIENLLQEHPAVGAVAVFGEKDEYYGEIVAAAVRLEGTATAAELAAFAADRIARFKVPAKFYAIETFPMTPSGKVRKVELRELAAAGKLTLLP
jgi:acyl-CoA synthetase (AMP-forming)/AMP-acid ligase II